MDDNRNESFGINGHLLRKGGVRIFATSTKIKVKYYIRYVDSLRNGDRGRWREKEQIRQNAKKQKGSSCDDGNSRKGPRVRDNQPFVLNFDTRPIFIGQETTNVAR